MFTFLMWGILLSVGVVQGSYQYYPGANGWVQEHRVIATWDEAFRRCKAEGAVLMSPITKNLRDVMRSRVTNDISYFIGVNARFHSGLFVSVEGILLEEMPVLNMLALLDSNDGQCLSMNRHSIRIVSCSSRLPYMCYKEHNDDFNVTECGTTDKEYKLSNSTGSCYKFHSRLTTWTEAYSTCILEGAYLAIVNDNNEAKEILNFIIEKDYYVSIGLKDWSGIGDWMSIFGDSIHDIYNVWEDDKQPAEPCCQIGFINPNINELKGFRDDSPSTFICEKDPNNIRFIYNKQLKNDDLTKFINSDLTTFIDDDLTNPFPLH